MATQAWATAGRAKGRGGTAQRGVRGGGAAGGSAAPCEARAIRHERGAKLANGEHDGRQAPIVGLQVVATCAHLQIP